MATDHFFVGGGAEHTAEMVRRDSYAKLKGAEGIAEWRDLEVLPLAQVGGGVRVTIGSAHIISRAQGAMREMYAGSVTIEETVTVAATGSSPTTGRSDLVVMRVRDPFVQGSPWQDPGAGIEDPEQAAEARAMAKYVFIEVIPGVPAGTVRLQNVPGYEYDTALTLARLDLPRDTVNVTRPMIKNLRNVAHPKKDRELLVLNLPAGATSTLSNASAYPTGGQTFPQQFVDAISRVFIPEWATHARIVTTWSSVKYPAGSNAEGFHWVQLGENSNPNVRRSQVTGYAAPMTNDFSDTTWVSADTIAIPAALRGKEEYFFPRANQLSGGQSGKLPWLGSSSAVVMDIEFFESAR